jgi:hypothetical protein
VGAHRTLSRDPSPFFPEGPKATPEKGIEAVPLVGLGENPGTPLVGTPEYNYDLTSPPSPKDSSPTPSSPSSGSSQAPLPDHDYKGCTKYCFDTTYTLHHHDHTAAEPTWTTATLIEERPRNTPRYGGTGWSTRQRRPGSGWIGGMVGRTTNWTHYGRYWVTPSRISLRLSSVGAGTEKGIMSRTGQR